MAAISNTLDSTVTTVEAQHEILPPIDREIATMLRDKLTAVGINDRTGAAIEEITDSAATPANSDWTRPESPTSPATSP